jgi:hypothetical protein
MSVKLKATINLISTENQTYANKQFTSKTQSELKPALTPSTTLQDIPCCQQLHQIPAEKNEG